MNNQTDIIPATTTAIVTAATRELTPGIWQMIEKMAPVMYKAHLFGVQSPDQAAAIMLKGYELGLSMTASFELVQVIQGKPALSPRGAMAILLSSNLAQEIKVERLEEKGHFVGYRCTMTRNNGFSFTAKFTMAEAATAGLVKPDSGWQKYPENMCMWRAIGFAADVVFPDVTAGMTTLMKAPEMYGVALTESGDVIDAPSMDMTGHPWKDSKINQPPMDPVQVAVNDLVTQYGAEQVLIAAGEIPTTMEKVEAVRKTLIEIGMESTRTIHTES